MKGMNFKKILSLVSIFCLLLTMSSVTSFATQETPEQPSAVVEPANAPVPAASVVTTQPQAITANVGDAKSLTFTVDAAVVEVTAIQWYKDGEVIAGANTEVLNFTAITLADAGNYYATFSADGVPDQTATATVTVSAAPVVTPEQAFWADIKNKIDTEQFSTDPAFEEVPVVWADIDITGSSDYTKMPVSVLESLRMKNAVLVIGDANGSFMWAIYGSDVSIGTIPADQEYYDMGVDISENPAISALVALLGEEEYGQLTLAHDGPFPFKGQLIMGVNEVYEGQTFKMYYYDETNSKLDEVVNDFTNMTVTDGIAILGFDHASEYVVTKAAIETPAVDPGTKTVATPVAAKTNPATGDHNSMMAMALLFMVALGGVVVLSRKNQLFNKK